MSNCKCGNTKMIGGRTCTNGSCMEGTKVIEFCVKENCIFSRMHGRWFCKHHNEKFMKQPISKEKYLKDTY